MREDAPTPGPLGDLEAVLADLWQRSRATARDLAHGLHPRLDPTAYPLLAVLGHAEAMRPSELSEALLLDRSTVTRQVDAAERLGLVTRVPDPRDARARLVALTPGARERLERLRRARLDRWHASLAQWPTQEVEQLTRLLERLRDAGVD